MARQELYFPGRTQLTMLLKNREYMFAKQTFCITNGLIDLMLITALWLWGYICANGTEMCLGQHAFLLLVTVLSAGIKFTHLFCTPRFWDYKPDNVCHFHIKNVCFRQSESYESVALKIENQYVAGKVNVVPDHDRHMKT